jgi:hypothetical protein
MAGHLFLDMPSGVARGIGEMQMQLATADVAQCWACQYRRVSGFTQNFGNILRRDLKNTTKNLIAQAK